MILAGRANVKLGEGDEETRGRGDRETRREGEEGTMG
jgi:hypothetical protein